MKRVSAVTFSIGTTAAILFMILGNCGTRKKAEGEEAGWPRWRGPNANVISDETNWDPAALVPGPRILRTADVGMGYSNVAIKNNRLYTMGRKGRESAVLCLNAETGRKIWRRVFYN